MMKRPNARDTFDDILKQQDDFKAQRDENPNLRLAATVQKSEKSKKSIFSRNRAKQKHSQELQTSKETEEKNVSRNLAEENQQQELETENDKEKILQLEEKKTKNIDYLLNTEIKEKMLGISNINEKGKILTNFVLGDIVERTSKLPCQKSNRIFNENEVGNDNVAFPQAKTYALKNMSYMNTNSKKSLFAQNFAVNKHKRLQENIEQDVTEELVIQFQRSLFVQNETTAAEIHNENLNLISSLSEEDVLAERQELLNTIDPALIAFINKRRSEQIFQNNSDNKKMNKNRKVNVDSFNENDEDIIIIDESNATVPILERNKSENWLHFDKIETDKLEWLTCLKKTTDADGKPGQAYEARFDSRGVLQQYTLERTENYDETLYMHSDEEDRPGYSMQELFRYARSAVIQQRKFGFQAITGILAIHQQGRYDRILDLPLTQIYFLLRYGLDDIFQPVIKAVTRSFASLLYNECDEMMQNSINDIAINSCQPLLECGQTKKITENENDWVFNISTDSNEEKSFCENKNSFSSDFDLAEDDLIDCIIQSNFLDRIKYLLTRMKGIDKDTLDCFLKIFIRLARSGHFIDEDMLSDFHDHLLITFDAVPENLELRQLKHFNLPNPLAIKLLRIMISHKPSWLKKSQKKFDVLDLISQYIFSEYELKGLFVELQCEALRLLRTVLLSDYNGDVFRKYISPLINMLDWHYNNLIFGVNGSNLLRQHASALISTIIAGARLGENVDAFHAKLHRCACKWFFYAKKEGVVEFSQLTLLTQCLHGALATADDIPYLTEPQVKFLRILVEFIESKEFDLLMDNVIPSSILLKKDKDRRFVHKALANMGAVIDQANGPQPIMTKTYPFYFLSILINYIGYLKRQLKNKSFENVIKNTMSKPIIVNTFNTYLDRLSEFVNTHLGTNLFAKIELILAHQLLTKKSNLPLYQLTDHKMFDVAFRVIGCMAVDRIPDILEICKKIIFINANVDIDQKLLNHWFHVYMGDLVICHQLYNTEHVLVKSATPTPLLPTDWPYYYLRSMLNYFSTNKRLSEEPMFGEEEIIKMTVCFASKFNKILNIDPTQQLMHLMIMFMGPNALFLVDNISALLHEHLLKFFDEFKDHTFDLDSTIPGMPAFENLYYQFVQQFQESSYGSPLFASLLLIPLAQKYPLKWRLRVWSEYCSAVAFIRCPNNLLMNGLECFLHPQEEDEHMLYVYCSAFRYQVRMSEFCKYVAAFHLRSWQRRNPGSTYAKLMRKEDVVKYM